VSTPDPKTVQAAQEALANIAGAPQQPNQPVYKPPGRRGKAALLTQHDPVVIKQLKEIALQHDMTQQQLVAKGLNYVFLEYGKPQIA